MADPRERLARLGPDERRILQVLSVICEPVGHAKVQEVLAVLGWKAQDGTPLSQQLGKGQRERLVHDGILSMTRSGYTCHPDVQELLTRDAVHEGCFAQIVAAAERVLPTRSASTFAWVADERRLRLFRVALYAGDEAAVLAQAGGQEVPLGQLDSGEVKFLVQACTRPAEPEWLNRLSPRLRLLALVPKLREDALGLTADPRDLRVMEEVLTPLAATEPDAAEALAEQYLLHARPAAAAPLLAGRDNPWALGLDGWRHFQHGEYPSAIERFEAAFAHLRKQSRKRRIYLPGLPGLLYLLTLLQRGTRVDREKVRETVDHCLRADRIDPVQYLFRQVGELAGVLSGDLSAQEAHWLSAHAMLREPFGRLFLCLSRHWLGERPAEPVIQALTTDAARAAETGLDWFAAEALALLRAVGAPGPLPELADPPAGLIPLAGLLAPKAQWELVLDALNELGAAAGAGAGTGAMAAAADRRLVWVLRLGQYRTALEPKEQKATRRGGWTAGRAVALQRLAEAPEEFPYLTPKDREICACIVREQEKSWYGNAARTLCRLDTDRALLAAVGHPCVIRDEAPETPLELVPAAPALTVERRRGDLLVRLEPFPREGETVLPVPEGAQRVRLVHFEPRHLEIARAIGPDGVAVPKAAVERLTQGLAAVAPVLTVHSDIGGGDTLAEAVPADARPHLHLSPIPGGLDLKLFVHPFGDWGPQLRPGEGRATLFAECDGRPMRCTRDLGAERAAARRVVEACPVLAGNPGWDWTLDDLEPALSALEQLYALGEDIALDWPQGKRIGLTPETRPGGMRIGISKRQDWLEIQGGLTLDDGRVLAMAELLERTAESQGRFVRLSEDQYLVLSEALRRRLDGLRGLLDQGRFHPLAAPAVEELIEGMELTASPAWKGILDRIAEAQSLEPEVPSTLQAELRDYQREGYRWLARLAHWGAGACLADDMGLGKTVQALALILTRAPAGPTLVIAPTSVCGNWMDEAARFAPTLRPLRFGPGDRAAMLAAAGPFDLIVTSYGLLQTEGERLGQVAWQTVVADEAQAFKNAQTKRSQAVMRINGGFRMIATGTPIENRLEELWNLFRFINPGLLGSLETFNRRFANPIEQQRDTAARARLRRLLKPFILRRLKSDVLSELPPRTEITLRLELSEGERALYEAMRRQAIERLEQHADGDNGQQRIRLLAEIMRLRRACCNPRLAMPDTDPS